MAAPIIPLARAAIAAAAKRKAKRQALKSNIIMGAGIASGASGVKKSMDEKKKRERMNKQRDR